MPPAEQGSCCEPAPDSPCCADASADSGTAPAGESTSRESGKAFGAMLGATDRGGAIDERTKELINFALVVMARCAPCVDVHLKKARDMGISPDELDEAAWCATAMGGAPVRLFYLDAMRGADPAGDGDNSGKKCCC